MKALKKLTFLIEDLSLDSPAQQLLDRFLMGYPRDGSFVHLAGCTCCVWTPSGTLTPELNLRMKDFGLAHTTDLESALEHSDGIVVAAKDPADFAAQKWLKPLVAQEVLHTPVFVYGVPSHSIGDADDIVTITRARKAPTFCGTAIATTWRLPDLAVAPGTPVEEGLIVVSGPFPQAELDGLEALFPLLEKRAGGLRDVRQVRPLTNAQVWQAGDVGQWSWPLLAAAISRSDSPQGDPVRDGRTQDLVGLGLVPNLAQKPRAWVMDHADGLRSTVLVLDGVVADINVALRTRAGDILSAQLYRPPAPNRCHFDRLVATIQDSFQKRTAPWPAQRGFLTARLLASFREMSA